MKRYVADFERPIVELESRLEELKKNPSVRKGDFAGEVKYLEKQIAKLRVRIYSNLTPWQKIQLARHPDRPRFSDYLSVGFSDFTEIHGDRVFGDDPAVIAGFAYLDKHRVMVIGTEKGKGIRDKVARNFGMPHPEGYRKAARAFKLAEKFQIPVVTFIDTPGAFPGIEAEERGQAIAIAENLRILSDLKVPVVAVVIGEGGSGGALALAVSDRIFMMENAYYSVIAPEGCASILWGDSKKAELAASELKLTADELLKLGVIDGIIGEPLGGVRDDLTQVSESLGASLTGALTELLKLNANEMLDDRYRKLMKIGVFSEKDIFNLSEGIKLIQGENNENRGVN